MLNKPICLTRISSHWVKQHTHAISSHVHSREWWLRVGRMIFYTKTFGDNLIPLNLTLIDNISDKSDQRSIWRHHTAFIDSNITETIFTGSDLRYAEFRELDINNVDFTDANLSNAKFRYINLNNVKPVDSFL